MNSYVVVLSNSMHGTRQVLADKYVIRFQNRVCATFFQGEEVVAEFFDVDAILNEDSVPTDG